MWCGDAYSQTRGLASLGKRLVGRIGRSSDSLAFAPLSTRDLHESVYEKNQEEIVEPAVLPDHLIPEQTEEYWAPHPETGVFGPGSDDKKRVPGVDGGSVEGSVLQQTAFFRPLEDLDKPPVELHK